MPREERAALTGCNRLTIMELAGGIPKSCRRLDKLGERRGNRYIPLQGLAEDARANLLSTLDNAERGRGSAATEGEVEASRRSVLFDAVSGTSLHALSLKQHFLTRVLGQILPAGIHL